MDSELQDREDLNIDRDILLFFNNGGSEALDPVIMLLTTSWVWIPLYLVLILYILRRYPRRAAFTIIAFAIVCVLCTAGVNELLVKPLVARPRPLFSADLQGLLRLVDGFRPSGYSFFSSHAANTSTLAVFLILVLRRWWIMVILVAYSLINCYTRLYLGAHYPSDILIGLSAGIFVAVNVYSFGKKKYFP